MCGKRFTQISQTRLQRRMTGTIGELKVKRVVQACAVALAAATCAPVLAASGDSLGAWSDYAAAGMTPDFSWADKPVAVAPTVLTAAADSRSAIAPGLTRSLIQGFSVQVSRATFGDTPALDASGFGAQRLARFGTGLERTFLTPSFTQAIDESTTVTGAVVLAQQQFATLGFGYSEVPALAAAAVTPTSVVPNAFTETSVGSGVRVQMHERLGGDLGLFAGYQSKIDMQAFQNYRGVYADPGDFDVPAIASAGLEWTPLARHRLGFNVQRVMYSDTAAFTSASLPRRFLSVLGDRDTSYFEWQDLTVYGLDWTYLATPRDAFTLRYATQTQPLPNDAALRAALAADITDHNYAFEYVRDLERWGSLSLAASYAPSQYFLGNWSRTSAADEGDQIELEAVWTVVF